MNPPENTETSTWVEDGNYWRSFIDASDSTRFVYFSFATQETVAVSDPQNDNDWDIGFLFRDSDSNGQYRLAIRSNGDVIVRLRNDDGGSIIATSSAYEQLNYNQYEENKVILFFQDENCIVFVNGEIVLITNGLKNIQPGRVSIATGIYDGDEVDGEVTNYEEAKVWSLN